MPEIIEHLAMMQVDVESREGKHRRQQAKQRQRPADPLPGILLANIFLVLSLEELHVVGLHRHARVGQQITGGVADELLRRLFDRLLLGLHRRIAIDLERPGQPRLEPCEDPAG